MLGGHYRNRVPDEWRAFTVREEMGLRSARAAAHVQCVLNNFFVSADDELEYKHALSLADSHLASNRI